MYAPIIYSWVTGCGGPRLTKEHYSGAHHSSSTALVDILSSPYLWFTRAPTILKIYIDTTYPVIGYYIIFCPVICITIGRINPCPIFASMYCSSPLNTQVIFYDGHDINFDGSSLKILWSHHIYYFIQKAGDSVNDQQNDNGQKLNLNHLYGNTIMNLVRKHETLNFTPLHMNAILFETCEAFKLSSATITQEYLNKTHLINLYPMDKGTNHQACLAATQTSNGKKADGIE